MKTIKSFITSAFVLLLCLSAQAQAPTAQFAGEDKEVMALPDSSQTVEIGLPGSTTEYCYEWTGDDIKTDPHQPVITVNPKKASNTYRVKRTGACGVEEDEVIVTLKDSVGIVSVTPKRKCYNNGDAISLSDFEIVTEPTGYESMVTLTPTTADNDAGWGQEDMELTFSLDYNGRVSTKKLTVKVFNEDLAATATTGSSIMKELLKEIDNGKFWVKKAGDAVTSISPCNPDYIFDINYAAGTAFQYCCNDKIIENGFRFDFPYVKLGLSVECDFPTSLSLPLLGGIYINLSVGGGINMGPMSINYRGEECSSITIPVGLFLSFSGGVKAKAISDDILTLQGNVVAEAKSSLVWEVGHGVKWKPLDVSVSIVGTATMLYGLYTEQFSYQVWTWSL